ncbi:MAG: 50S ribosomal protein L19 [Chitinispirillaceae bacterium]|nr:50S ribosomal protein L19 [Chitinispirillaceae bacterium]
MQEIIKKVELKEIGGREIKYKPGDTIAVSFRIKEGDKERIQEFQGVVIRLRGNGANKTVTVRKSSGNVYVERIFPVYSPLVSEIRIVKRGKVRRAKLYYLRKLSGKATRIEEKR